MSTWATRLSESCGGRDASLSSENGNAKSAFAVGATAEGAARRSCHASRSERCRVDFASLVDDDDCIVSAVAQVHNAEKVAVLHLPADCWELVTSYLSCADVARVTAACHSLWGMLHCREGVWRQQLRHFRSDMRDLRGGSLLLTCFAVPTGMIVGSYARLRSERQLYQLDAQREWHFNDVCTLDDAAVGIFTVPLQLRASKIGGEGEDESIVAVLSSPPIGHPYQVGHAPMPELHIIRPVRQPARCAESYHKVLPRRLTSSQQRANLNACAGLDEDDDAALQYAIALSRLDAVSGDACSIDSSGQLGGLSRGSRINYPVVDGNTVAATASLSRSFILDSVNENSSTASAPLRSGLDLHVHELMTLIDLLATGNTGASRVQFEEVTEAENALFRDALAQTLQAAMRRRLHLGNHHRALRNNGQGSRHRRGHSGRSTTSTVEAELPSLYTGGRLPPVNRILHNFRGQLLEITQREAEEVCRVLLGQPSVLRDFVLPHTTDSLAPLPSPTRFFLAPELCTGGLVGLFVVDLVRLLVIVQPEVADASRNETVLHVMPNGRVAPQRMRLNEQPVTRIELWGDELVI